MSRMPWYKRNPGQYQAKTGHLSLIEHGAYTVMLDAHYATRQPLPIERQQVFRLARAITSAEKKAVSAILDQFWVETVDGWINKRAQAEIKRFDVASERNRKIALEREAAKRKQERNTKRGTNRATKRATERDTNASRDVTRPEHDTYIARPRAHVKKEERRSKSTPKPPKGDSRNGPTFDFDLFKAAYPKRSGSQPWGRAAQCANARIKEGSTFGEMLDGARRYRAHCDRERSTGTKYVMQAKTFLGPERHFLESWEAPLSGNMAAAEEAIRMTRESAHANSDPWMQIEGD